MGVPADVYCLGGILYFILTGAPPRGGSPADVMEQLASGSAPPEPRGLDPRVSPDLERLCMGGLVGHPSKRFGSARLFADAVEGYLEGRSLAAPRAEDANFLRGYSSRNCRRPSVTVDVAVMTRTSDGVRVALLRRDQPPFLDTWACPGTLVRLEEPLEGTVERVLRDKAGGPTVSSLVQIGAFGDPRRDPRTRVITVAYLALVPPTHELPRDSSTLAWFDLSEVEEGVVLRATGSVPERPEDIELAFDHGHLLRAALQAVHRLR